MNNVFQSLVKKIEVYPDSNSAIESIREYIHNNNKAVVAFANAHAFNLAKQNTPFFEHLLNADFLLRDGIGVKLYYKMIGIDPGHNLNGTDFIPELLAAVSSKKKLAIFGTSEKVISAAQPKVELLGGALVLSAHGFYDIEYYLDLVKELNADIYILAMGMPKQEALASKLYNQIDHGLIICGGAVIDFIGGKVKRAPVIYRRLGLEWLYRLLNEPKRMFTRYVIGNLIFLFSAFKSIT